MKKLVALAFAALAAYRYGAWAGTSIWGGQPHAALYGIAAVLAGVWVVAYAIQDEYLFSLAFAAVAAHLYGPQVGRWYNALISQLLRPTAGYQRDINADEIGAAFYGGTSVFLAAFIAGFVIVWPIVRRIGADAQGQAAAGWQRFWISRKKPAPIDTADIERLIGNGMVFDYRGLIDRDYGFNDGRPKTGRVRVDFSLRRNTMAMSDPDQEAVRIWHVLTAHNALPRDAVNRLQFALAWGEGHAELYGGKIAADPRVLQQIGIKNLRDAVTLEAGHLNLSTGGALSELHTALQQAALPKDAPPGIVKLYDRYCDKRHGQLKPRWA